MNIIKVKPNEEGKLIIKLYGTTYEIVVEEPTKEEPKEEKPNKKARGK